MLPKTILRCEKSLVSLNFEATSANKSSTPPYYLSPPTPMTPLTLEPPAQPGCFVIAASEELDIPPRLVGAA